MPREPIFRMMTFNLLITQSRLSRQALNRDDLAAGVILSQNPDVVCLQECDGQFRQEEVNLPGMIAGLFAEVLPAGVDPLENWNPIFYRRERFDLISCGHKVYSVGTEHPYRGVRTHFRSLNWAVLRERESGQDRIVLNTHLDTVPEGQMAECVTLVETVRDLRVQYGGPILVAGDYNGRVNGIGAQALSALGFTDTCSLAEENLGRRGFHPEPKVHFEPWPAFDVFDPRGSDEDYAKAIDHVMLWGEGAVRSYRTVICEAALLASDHCPVVVDLKFAKD